MNPPFIVQLDLQPIYVSFRPDNKTIQHWIETTLNYMHAIKPCILQDIIAITVRIVDKPDIQKLNKDYRKKDKPTNVLSFPSALPSFLLSSLDEYPLGDIILCAPVIEQEAQDHHKVLLHHWAHMIVHSTLHLLGYDHVEKQEAEKMELYESAILHQLGFPNPYYPYQKESE